MIISLNTAKNIIMRNNEELHEWSWNLVKKFQQLGLSVNLQYSDHNSFHYNFYSQYHMEGSVLTHTMMVYSHMIRYLSSPELNIIRWKELLVAALLHDIGKPTCREWVKDKQRIMFKGHAGVSTFMSIDKIKELVPEFDQEQIVYTLRLINYHGDLFELCPKHYVKYKDTHELFGCLYTLRDCDSFGNISKKPNKDNWENIKEASRLIRNSNDTTWFDEGAPKATFLIGLPCSGKSTYYNDNKHLGKLISRDDILLDLAETMDYNEAWNKVDQKEVDKLFREKLQLTMKEKEDIVIDRTNLTYKGRMKFVNQLRQNRYNIHYKVFLIPYETLMRRNGDREDKTISWGVYLQMSKSFSMPYDNEYLTIEYLF